MSIEPSPDVSPATARRTHHVCVFIGRFRPLHNAHLKIIREALRRGDLVVIVVGSFNMARSERNSFMFAEIERMIRLCLSDEEQSRVVVTGVADVLYDHGIWDRDVRQAVNAAIASQRDQIGIPEKPSIALIGHAKDHTSYYLNRFREWDSINVPMEISMSATDIRNALFGPKIDRDAIVDLVPPPVLGYLDEFAASEKALWLRREYAANQRHREPFEAFSRQLLERHGIVSEVPQITADIALIQSGHVLMTRRNEFPGEGLWSLPGTFLAPNERLEDCAFRGLMTKTRVRVPEEILRANIRVQASYHHPHRSARGRILTEGFLIQLPRVHQGNTPFPKVKGPDDGRFKPWWVSLADLRPEECYEDHYPIIMDLIRRDTRG